METIPATALLIDIRAFTPRLSRYLRGQGHVNLPRVVSDFCAGIVTECTAVYSGDPGDALYLNSTGDGALVVFFQQREEAQGLHALRAYVAAVCMMKTLPELLEGNGIKGRNRYDYQFGIGVESGEVEYSGVRPSPRAALHLDTYLGHCINIASRLEVLTKSFDRTCVIIGEQLNNILARELLGIDYPVLATAALDSGAPNRRASWDQLKEANDKLLLDYIGRMDLEGCESAVMGYRVSPGLVEEHGRQVMQSCAGRLDLTMD